MIGPTACRMPPGDWCGGGGANGVSEKFEELFANVQVFDWNPNKRDQAFRERHIAFEDAPVAFQGPITIRRSDRKGEVRYMVFGYLGDVEVVFVCTFRGDVCWIISARRASRDERKKYYDRPARGAAEDQE
jgi:uncharacterized DUF497 family protein